MFCLHGYFSNGMFGKSAPLMSVVGVFWEENHENDNEFSATTLTVFVSALCSSSEHRLINIEPFFHSPSLNM